MHAVSAADQRRPRLLAIDDSELIHRLLKARLKNERLEIHAAINGAQGLALARTLKPDVILLDLNLPGVDGFGVLHNLKTDPLCMEIPVIVLTGSPNTADTVRALDMGAHDIVGKPFSIGELRARVRSALRIRSLIRMLAQMAHADGLTGLWNRAHFDHRLGEEIAHAIRHGTPLALIMGDLDHFKRINDQFGHPFGDLVLEEFAGILQTGRAGDVACRYGGEEFAIILPQTTADAAMILAQRIQQRIREHLWPQAKGLQITASFGITDLERTHDKTLRTMVQLADEALYSAKSQGRDCIQLAPAAPRNDSVRMSA